MMSCVLSLWRGIAQRGIAPVLAAALSLLPLAPLHAATQWHVAVGAESRDQGIQLNEFFSNELFINAGDSVTWTFETGEIHTVTFLSGGPRPPLVIVGPSGPQFNPVAAAPAGGPTYNGIGYVNSGVLAQGAPPFTLTFTQAGDFPYVCLIHMKMTGVIHMRPAGTPYPHDQTFYDRQAHVEIARLLGRGARLQAQGLVAAVRAPGHTAVTSGIGEFLEDGSIAVMRFLPEKLVVRAGQTVVWTNLDPETPHTITFGPEPAGGPLGAFAPAGTDGPGHATISAPGQAVNSGFVGADFPFGTTFSVTFTKPGTYPYICALHDELGMVGTIVVVP